MDRRIAPMLVLLLVAMSGCAKPVSQPQQTALPEPAPKQDVTLNLGTEPPSLDPNKVSDAASLEVLTNVMEGLVRLGRDEKPVPGIAETWTVSSDGKTYTFRLREARWSDGRPVTAHDFVFSWMRALNPKTAADYAYQFYYIEGAEAWNTLDVKAKDFTKRDRELKEKVAIRAPDSRTLEVRLNGRTPYFLGLLAFPTFFPLREDSVKEHGTKFGSEPYRMLYNGPFQVIHWAHESEIVLQKNPHYWDAGAVRLEKVTYKMIGDVVTALNLFEVGELHQVDVPGELLDQYRTKGLQTMASASTFYLTFNLQKPEFKDHQLRQAISLAIDRQVLTNQVLRNGAVPSEGFVPPSLPGHLRPFRMESGRHIPLTSDKLRAQKLWREALANLGASKLSITILTGDNPITNRLSQSVQAMLQETLPGLEVKLQVVSGSVRLDRTRRGDFDIVYGNWVGDYNDPMTFMDMFGTGAPYNDARWTNKQFDDLIQSARATTDPAIRMQAMVDAEKILMREMPIIPVYHPARNWVDKPRFKGTVQFVVAGTQDLKWAYVEDKRP